MTKHIAGGGYGTQVDTIIGNIEGIGGSRGDDLMFTYEDGGVSMVVDGEREWLYSWVAGYHGDDTLVWHWR